MTLTRNLGKENSYQSLKKKAQISGYQECTNNLNLKPKWSYTHIYRCMAGAKFLVYPWSREPMAGSLWLAVNRHWSPNHTLMETPSCPLYIFSSIDIQTWHRNLLRGRIFVVWIHWRTLSSSAFLFLQHQHTNQPALSLEIVQWATLVSISERKHQQAHFCN